MIFECLLRPANDPFPDSDETQRGVLVVVLLDLLRLAFVPVPVCALCLCNFSTLMPASLFYLHFASIRVLICHLSLV